MPALGTIAQLADFLINGYWQSEGTIAHHWTSTPTAGITITYNLGNLTASEQTLAHAALGAWQGVADISFVQVASGANITFNHNGTMTASTGGNWSSQGVMTSATVDISQDWITSDGGARDGYS